MTNIEPLKNKFYKESLGMILILFLEFILGIYTTLFLSFPENSSKSALWKFASSDNILNLHMILGIALVIGAVNYLIRAIIYKQSNQIYSALTATLGVCLATYGEVMFVPSQKEIYSFIMSIGFVIAIVGYGYGLIKKSL